MSSLESYIKTQDDVYARLSRAKTNFKKSPKERLTKQYLETRLENVEELWAQFNLTHTQIVKDFEPKDVLSLPYTQNETFYNAEELYLDLKCQFKTALSKFQDNDVIPVAGSSSTNVLANKNMSIKLPKITIPSFSGKYIEWPTFRDLFVSAIHKNSSIDKVQKLHYLKSYLTGEAEQLLRHIPISESNYDRCWAQLETRYNNKKYLSHCILKRLLSQRIIVQESASALKELMDTTTDCLNALSNLDIDVSSWDILIIHIITIKLDPDSRKDWELKVASNTESDKLPTFEQFKEFLTSRYRAFEFIETKPARHNIKDNVKVKVFHMVSIVCQYCQENHKLGHCKQFVNANVDTRRRFVQNNNLCFNCLGHNHSARVCKCTASCRICRRRHHSLLHPNDEQESGVKIGDKSIDRVSQSKVHTHSVEIGGEQKVVTCFSKGVANNQVLLATALVRAESRNGFWYTIRALLDQGSQASFVTENIVQRLGLSKKPAKGLIVGIDVESKLSLNSMVEVMIQSRIDPSYQLVVQAYVLKSLTSLLPVRETSYLDWAQVNDIQLADPKYYKPDTVDMLLGADIYSQILQNGLKKAPGGNTVAQCTSLGWILSGTVSSAFRDSSNITVMHTHLGDDDILKRFWELEKEPSQNKKHILTEEESRCEEIFKTTTVRDEEGRYVVHLPFKSRDPSCKYGESKRIAVNRFYALEAKLNKNLDLKARYTEVINEYLQLGHMKEISKQEAQNQYAVYLPHHAVIRNDKDTTKLRVVFDASCKGKNGVSLNDNLMVGPVLQSDLRHLLIRWRTFRICLVADIVKMYRMIRIADQHTDFQRIIWRDGSEIKDYKLLTVTFGTSSAPFLAVRAMQQAAYDDGASYPLAAERVLKDYYMDDLMTGCDTIEKGIQIYQEMNELLGKAGFTLQKWSSNSNELLENIIGARCNGQDSEQKQINIKQDEIFKTLGLTWNRSCDTFQYSVQLPPMQEPVTKRKVLSDIAKLFDPLGWVAPVVILAKILIQKLWISGIDWDQEIPTEIKNEWSTYRQELPHLTEFSIPRWLNMTHGDKQVDLHGFCDASKFGYAAVVYARVVDADGQIHITLLTAKTKVAPIKTVSIPRLELCGAVLLVKLLSEVSEVMGIEKSNVFYWTDSEIVLAWLNSHPNKWKTFVANRVSEILCMSEPQQWHHVQSKNNPADCASRGIYASEFVKLKLWLNGPELLKHKNIPFSKGKQISTNIEEIKVHIVAEDNFIWDKYSSLSRLIRITAYLRRFLELRKPKLERKKYTYLTTEEIQLALETCIRVCQKQHFEAVILDLHTEKPKRKMFKSLNLYFDSVNILRVGGRLERSGLDSDRKHPILIPSNSHFTGLLVAEAHKKNLHGGPQLMLNYLSTKYYIQGVKRLIRAYVRKCVTCLRHSAATKPQLMGQLPPARVTPSRPFRNSGVDYAGPINLRTSKGRGHRAYKGYICLFVCMATKAVHIEVVSDLTTQGFLGAFKRFVARRGHCQNLWSDNGTNFQGASRELKALFKDQNSKESIAKDIAAALALEGTTWHFIPPHAPNFGGLWEAAIKSCKKHLHRVIGNSTLTFEEITTLLSQIEACLNSRPLCRLTNSDSGNALTPGHFLVGEPIVNAPDINYENSSISSLRRWHLVQKMTQDFWRRWSSEYLTTLLHRYKWSKQTPEPTVGDVVLIKEDNLPPCRWLLGRVVEKHPGLDNITRVVTIRSKDSLFKRPTSKLCVLPID